MVLPHIFPFTPHYRLPITDYPIISNKYFGSPTHFFLHPPLPITHYQLPITNYLLPITYYLLPITYYPLPITHYRLPNQIALVPVMTVSPVGNDNPSFGSIVTKTLVVVPHLFKGICSITLPSKSGVNLAHFIFLLPTNAQSR